MNTACCSHCFEDKTLKALLERDGERSGETCVYCGSDSGASVSTSHLSAMFRRVVDAWYVPVDELNGFPLLDPIEEGSSLSNLLDGDCPVFSDAVSNDKEELLYDILNAIGDPKDDRYGEGLWASKTQDLLHRGHHEQWHIFSDAARTHGRALVGPSGKVRGGADVEEAVDVLRQAAEDVATKLPRNENAWRARPGAGHRGDALGAPPAHKAIAGRANFKGEPVLYLAFSRKTAVYETRPSIGDTVSVGRFKLTRDLRICDLRKRFEVCTPFVDTDAEFAQYLEVASRNDIRAQIGARLAAPVTRGDEDSEYLPTQVFTTLIRDLGFDGLCFSSTQRGGGDNLVLFNPEDAAVQTSTREYEIRAVRYDLHERPQRRKSTIGPGV